MTMTSAELFAVRGDMWNAHPEREQFRASPREFKTHRHPDGTLERNPYDEVEGYETTARGPRAAIHKPDFVEPNPPVIRKRSREEVSRVNVARRATRIMQGREIINVRH